MMPDSNTFLSRACANDPLIFPSLWPKKLPSQLDRDNWKHDWQTPSHHDPLSQLSSGPQIEDFNKPDSIAASPLDPEVSDLDLPSSVVEEIEVISIDYLLLVTMRKIYQTCFRWCQWLLIKLTMRMMVTTMNTKWCAYPLACNLLILMVTMTLTFQ